MKTILPMNILLNCSSIFRINRYYVLISNQIIFFLFQNECCFNCTQNPIIQRLVNKFHSPLRYNFILEFLLQVFNNLVHYLSCLPCNSLIFFNWNDHHDFAIIFEDRITTNLIPNNFHWVN